MGTTADVTEALEVLRLKREVDTASAAHGNLEVRIAHGESEAYATLRDLMRAFVEAHNEYMDARRNASTEAMSRVTYRHRLVEYGGVR